MSTMSVTHFHVRWPDQTHSKCYSPSSIIKNFLRLGETYAVDEFVARSRKALEIASGRVRRKFGYSCAHAAHTVGEIERIAARFADQPDARIVVESFEE
jgi:uncharacterized repeat protein (TIGR04042 family)